MSALGRNVGIIGLGLSCQGSLQIRDNIDVLARVSGDDTLKASGMPFDSIICPPASAAKMLRNDTFFPRDNAEIQVFRGAFWKDYNVYFRHEYTLRKSHPFEYWRGKVNASRALRELTSKFGYMAEKFRNASRLDRLIFVISNTQNDLFEYKEEVGIDYGIAMKSIDDLCDECDRYFSRRCEYIFATYEDRVRGRSTRERLAVYRLVPDASVWGGDRQQWKDLFENYFARATVLAACS